MIAFQVHLRLCNDLGAKAWQLGSCVEKEEKEEEVKKEEEMEEEEMEEEEVSGQLDLRDSRLR